MIRKLLKIIGLAILSLIVLLGIWWLWPERTPRIKPDSPKAIASIEYLPINGIDQCVLTRTHDTSSPVILFLHGGPGMPMMFLAHEFQYPLEKYYTVVQWDRRAAGKTFSRNEKPISNLSVRQLIDDAWVLIDTLKNRYHIEKIYLAGHSFGTYLGSIMVTKKPHLFHAYISIGQVVDAEMARPIQEEFIIEKATLHGREDILSALNQDKTISLENFLFEFGGELKESTSFFPLVWSGLQAPEYTLPEVMDVAKGSAYSSANMEYNVLENSIYNEIQTYAIPIYFFVGKSDYTTPHALIEAYYNIVEAPEKKIIWFDQSAHFPFFEEPGKFSNELIRLLPGAAQHR